MLLFPMRREFIRASIRLGASLLVALVHSPLLLWQMRLHVPVHFARLRASKLTLFIMDTFDGLIMILHMPSATWISMAHGGVN